jgi:glyoxylase-like metal-dependent hydrolase (beta-lactamase superfamily II)
MKIVNSFRFGLTCAALAASVAFVACSNSQAASEIPALPAGAQSGFYKLTVGDVEVIALSDGTIGIEPGLLNGDAAKIQAALVQGYETSPVSTSVNAYLIKAGSRLILVDAGTSELFGPSLGKLPGSLRNAGYNPEQITDILVTHIHTDHTGGLMLGDSRVFPNARVHIERKEADFWLNPANRASAPEGLKTFFDQAVAKVTPYVQSGQVDLFDGSVEIFPGIRSIPAPGHTPGHTLYQLESKGSKLVFWGDVLHVAAVQMPDPGVTIQFDVTPSEAKTQRDALFADAASKGYMVAPAHINFPGFGRLRTDGTGYRWYPVPYVNDISLNAR